MQVDSMKY